MELVPLAEARDAALRARRLVLAGVGPIEAKRGAKAEAAAERGRATTFGQVADAYVRAHGAGWRNPEHRAQWRSALETYAFPRIGDVSVASVDTGMVLRVLEPISRPKPETAGRLRGRIEAVLDYVAARGWRAPDNPARWRGHLAKLPPPGARIARVEHHAALPWQEVPAFIAALCAEEGLAARALECAVLTAGRTGEVLGARWAEIDASAALWTVPSSRRKGGREHRVPLAEAALAVLRGVEPLGGERPGVGQAEPGADEARASAHLSQPHRTVDSRPVRRFATPVKRVWRRRDIAPKRGAPRVRRPRGRDDRARDHGREPTRHDPR